MPMAKFTITDQHVYSLSVEGEDGSRCWPSGEPMRESSIKELSKHLLFIAGERNAQRYA